MKKEDNGRRRVDDGHLKSLAWKRTKEKEMYGGASMGGDCRRLTERKKMETG